MSPQPLCSSLRQAESSLACLYITPKGFALHAALLSFSIEPSHLAWAVVSARHCRSRPMLDRLFLTFLDPGPDPHCMA